MARPLPSQTADLTAEWLTEALQGSFPGVSVADARIVAERGSTNHHVRLGVTYAEPVGAPETIFCKMAPLDAAHRAAVNATGMGAREARFYSDLAPALKMRIPTPYFSAADDEGRFVILLEDLNARGCRVSDGTWGLSVELAAKGLADLAELHVLYEDPAALATVRPWIVANPPGSVEFTVPVLRQVLHDHRSILSDDYVAIGEMYVADPHAVIALWKAGSPTVVHGDAHLGNVFVDGDRIGFFDWGLMDVAPPMRDVSYFLSLQLMAEDRRPNERDLLRHYLDVRRSLGGSPIDFDAAWQEHRLQSAYLVLASFLSLVPPYNGEDQRAFSDAFRNRAIEAIDDLGTAAALRDALG